MGARLVAVVMVAMVLASPIQSLAVGDAIAFHVAVTVPPAATGDGLSVRVTAPPPPLVTVKAALVASRTKPSLLSSRNS